MLEEIHKFAKLLQEWVNRLIRDYYSLQKVFFWIAAIITGLVAVGYAWLFDQLKYLYLQALETHSALVFLLSPLCFLSAWYIVRRFAPAAAGSGIPQVMVASEVDYKANQRYVDQLVSIRGAGVKIISSLLMVLGGGAVGREGPTLQISASIFHLFGRISRRFHTEAYASSWFVAGAAAGLASAFNTPLGGIVYAIEELGVAQFNRFKSSLLSAVIISGLVAQWIFGSYLFLGFPRLSPISHNIIPYVIFAGLVSGLMGAAFGRCLWWFVRERQKILDVRRLAIVTACCGLVIASITVLEPRIAGPGINLVSSFLFDGETADLSLLLGRFFATLITYVAGGAGGIFAPSLSIGATLGSLFGKLVATDHSNLMVLLGMIGFLTGVTRTPFTAFVLVLEMTDRHSAIFPMMLAAFVAHGAARIIDTKSFYELMKEHFLAQAAVFGNEKPPSSTGGESSGK